MALKTVDVPEAFEPVFMKAESAVAAYFDGLRRDPARGTIEIAGERYVLVRAASLSVEFFEMVRRLFGRGRKKEADGFSRNLLFDLAHAVGRSDARCFHGKMGLSDPVERLSAGPIHFAHTGWAHVDISPESHPTADEDYYLIYDHPYSFEADAWLESRSLSAFPVCIMNAGYSSGWCEESFGVPLVATEVLCRARGDVCCRFIMAPPERIEERVGHYMQVLQGSHHSQKPYVIPGLFERKRMEESLRESEERLRKVVGAAQDAIIMLDGQGKICLWNESAERIFGYTAAEVKGQDLHKLIAPARFHDAYEKGIMAFHRSGQGNAVGRVLELAAVRKGGEEFPIELSLSAMQLQGEWHAVGVVRDITERKRSEAALRASEERYRVLVSNVPAAVYEAACDTEWTVRYVSGAVEGLLGYPASDFIGNRVRKWADVVHPEDHDWVEQTAVAAMKQHEQFDLTYRMVHADGGIRWVRHRGFGIMDARGQLSRVEGVILDVTAEKRVEELERERDGLREALKEMERVVGEIGPALGAPQAGAPADAGVTD